jgi:hypothetical protein
MDGGSPAAKASLPGTDAGNQQPPTSVARANAGGELAPSATMRVGAHLLPGSGFVLNARVKIPRAAALCVARI